MYNQIIHFIIAIFIYSANPSPPEYFVDLRWILITFLAQLYAFSVICKKLFGRSLEKGFFLYQNYVKLEQKLWTLVTLFFAFTAYGLNIKHLFEKISLVSKSISLSNLLGLSVYFIYLILLWHRSYPYYKVFQGSNISLMSYIRKQASFSLGILVPWMFLLVLMDIGYLLFPSAVVRSELAQLGIFVVGIFLFGSIGIGMVLKLWNCQRMPFEGRRFLAERFFREHRFKIKDILFWSGFDERALTAGIVGFLPWARYILITPALNRILDNEEFLAVMAHEMGHAKKNHMFFYIVIFAGYGLVMSSFDDLLSFWLLEKEPLLKFLVAKQGVLSTAFSAFVISLPFLFLLVFYFRFVFGYFSRNFERQADLYAFEVMKTPWPLVGALEKVALFSGKSKDEPSWHHYSIKERIDFLKEVEFNPYLSMEHDKRVARIFRLFVVAQIVLVIIGFSIENSKWFENKMVDLNIRAIAYKLGYPSISPELYSSYGGYLIDRNAYQEAEKVLLRGLSLFPENPDILNNIAWFYATSPSPFRNPKKAVSFAEKAVKINPESPYIWDTLAEAYYSAGRYKEALNAINKALSLNQDDYYLAQKKKIERALDEHNK